MAKSKWAATTQHKFLQLSDQVLGTYNSWDCHFAAMLVNPLFKEIEERGNLRYYQEIIEPLQWAVIDMASRGLLIDRSRLNSHRTRIRRELAETDEKILRADPTRELSKPTAKYPNSIGSSKKLSNFLFNTLGLKAQKKTTKGFSSTDQESLMALIRGMRKKDAPHLEVLHALFHRSRLKTIYQRYLSIDTEQDGRIYPTVKMCGAKTWRFAYESPPLQQFPPEIRDIIIAPPGFDLIEADYSQLEARLLAYQAVDDVSIRVFEAGGDIHVQNARDLLGMDLDAWESSLSSFKKAARNFAKTFLYGISYGGQAETMKAKLFCPCPKCEADMPISLNLSRPELRKAENRWFSLHPAVKSYQEVNSKHVNRFHYFESPLIEGGMRRYITKPPSRELSRELANIPNQLGGAILMNRSQVYLYASGCPIILQNHDAFLVESQKEDKGKWARVLRDKMEKPVKGLGGIQFPVDLKIGQSWGEMEKWQSPETPKTDNRNNPQEPCSL